MAVNEGFETDFEIDDPSKAVLQIQNSGVANREKITADEIGSTSFQAKLSHVQYGTNNGKPAALLIFNFQFGFRSGSWKRITSASIKLTFEETVGPDLTLPIPHNPNNDPIVALIAPAQVCGDVTSVQKTKKWNLSVPIQFQQFGVQGGVDDVSDYRTDHRMWLTGISTSEDTHHENNSVIWDIQENSMQASGILHRFPGAVVIELPKSPEHHVRVTGLIRPFVAFSMNPLRLKQKKDDPIYLDRKQTKGTPIMPGVDFNDKSFPWQDIVKIPTEYEGILTA